MWLCRQTTLQDFKQIKRLTMHQNILKPIFFLRNQVRQKVSVLELFFIYETYGFPGIGRKIMCMIDW